MWRRNDATSLEHCRLSQLPDAYALHGCVLALHEEHPIRIQYRVDCDTGWLTRSVHIHVIRGAAHHRLRLSRDRSGTWWRGDDRMPELEGLSDVDLSITPSTNTLPIRRLSLTVGAAASSDAVWVRFPDLTIERLPQRYTRNAERRYTYESRGGSFVADLDVDAQGLVTRYGDIWERVGATE